MSTLTRWERDAIALCARAPNARTLTYARVTVQCPVEDQDRDDPDANTHGRTVRYVVASVGTASFPNGFTLNDPVTLDGVAHTLRDTAQRDDGLITDLYLAKVAP